MLVKSGIVSWKVFNAYKTIRKTPVSKTLSQSELLDRSINDLARNKPEYSAKRTFSLAQIIVFCSVLLLLSTTSLFASAHVAFFTASLFSIFYIGSIVLRMLLLGWFDRRVRRSLIDLSASDQSLPVYSILVPLYKEANQVADLTAHLMGCNWPADKLDIKLICEADDLETIDAIKALQLPSIFELVKVPKSEPRTKPKAMNFALPLCRGQYLVIYDAEDRPSKNQLREAYSRFQSEDDNLACLQAPLAIHNKHQNWLTGLFAIEYYTLFCGMLPVLARWKAPLPLGGTSNHFKMNILKAAGGWDPYNVTEDADLGIRLYREGYRSSTLTQPTWEEAPPEFWPWLTQRTRWMKGWMQTILVHNRNPTALIKELGLRNGIVFHLLMTCIVISGLIHPVFLGTLLWTIFFSDQLSMTLLQTILAGICGFNLIGGYLSYMLLALVVLQTSNLFGLVRLIVMLPIYWLMISLACWRAAFQLIFLPHKWEKTPHGLAKDTI